MEPITLIAAIITFVGGVGGAIVFYVPKASRYLAVLQVFLTLVQSYMKGSADHTWTDEEYLDLGKKSVELAKSIDLDEKIEAGFNFLNNRA